MPKPRIQLRGAAKHPMAESDRYAIWRKGGVEERWASFLPKSAMKKKSKSSSKAPGWHLRKRRFS